MQDFVAPSEIRKKYQVSHSSLLNWAKADKVRSITTPGGNRRYHIGDVRAAFGDTPDGHGAAAKRTIIYARVSSAKQKPDLERQIALLKRAHPEFAECKSAVASGLNCTRRGFLDVLDSVRRGGPYEKFFAKRRYFLSFWHAKKYGVDSI